MTEIDLEEKSLRNMVLFYKSQLISVHQGQTIHKTDLKKLKNLRLIHLNSHDGPAHFELTDLAKRLLGVS